MFSHTVVMNPLALVKYTFLIIPQGRILDRLGICNQVRFTRWCTGCIMARRRPVPNGLRIKDLTFAEVPVRVYEPMAPCSGKRRALVYFHGGGWVSGSIGKHRWLVTRVSRQHCRFSVESELCPFVPPLSSQIPQRKCVDTLS